MIRCVITSSEIIGGGMLGVVRKLRAAGIPVRQSGDELRLCKVWTTDGSKCLGYGKLQWSTDARLRDTEFCYEPPSPVIDPDVIDVESRVVIDIPRLGQ